MNKAFSLLLLAVAVCGCANKYRPYTFVDLGYSDTKLENDTFLVSYEGNTDADTGAIHKNALVRAAEVTKENGFEYFTIVSSQGFRPSSCCVTPACSNKPVSITIQAFQERPSAESFFCANQLVGQMAL